MNTLGFSAAEAKDGLEPNWALLKLSGVEEHLVPKSLRDFSRSVDFGIFFIFKYLLHLEFI